MSTTGFPFAPVAGVDLNPSPSIGVDPRAFLVTARGRNGMDTVTVDNGNLQVALGRHAYDLIPFHKALMIGLRPQEFDLYQADGSGDRMSGKSGEDAPQLPITRPLPTSAPRCW
jgi:hypothetical protein